jgi:hypothetical protein
VVLPFLSGSLAGVVKQFAWKLQKLSLTVSDGRGFMEQLMEKLERDELEEALTVARLI